MAVPGRVELVRELEPQEAVEAGCPLEVGDDHADGIQPGQGRSVPESNLWPSSFV
jgi:hypothetical protein